MLIITCDTYRIITNWQLLVILMRLFCFFQKVCHYWSVPKIQFVFVQHKHKIGFVFVLHILFVPKISFVH